MSRDTRRVGVRIALPTLLAASLALAPSGPAGAAGVTVSGGVIAVTLGPAEPGGIVTINGRWHTTLSIYQLYVDHREASSVTVAGCTDESSWPDDGAMYCNDIPRPTSYTVTGNAAHDELRLWHEHRPGDPRPTASVSGGGGNDQLYAAGVVSAVLDGGPGDDIVNPDHEYGSFHTERLPGTVARGGPGTDTLYLEDAAPCASGPVVITLDDVADDGCAGEGDDYASDFERVHGTTGLDHIEGTERADQIDGEGGGGLIRGLGGDDVLVAGNGALDLTGVTIDGGAGNDTITGADNADDTLVGGPGKDSVNAQGGNDTVDLRDGSGGDRADCGAGADTVYVDPGDQHTGCERVVRAKGGLAPKLKGKRLTAAQGKVALKLKCASKKSCKGAVRITGPGKDGSTTLLAKGSYRVPARGTRTIRVKLTKAGKKAARKVTGTLALVPKGSPAGRETKVVIVRRR